MRNLKVGRLLFGTLTLCQNKNLKVRRCQKVADQLLGFSFVVVVMTLVALSGICLAFVTIVSKEAETSGLMLEYQKARALAYAGLSRTQDYLSQDGNWTDTPQNLFQNIAEGDGIYSVKTQNATQDTISVISEGSVGSANVTLNRDFTIEIDPDYGGYLPIDLDVFNIAPDKKIQGIQFSTTSVDNPVVLDQVKIDFSPKYIDDGIRRIEVRTIGEGGFITKWNGTAAPGIWINVDNANLLPNKTYEMNAHSSDFLTGERTYTISLKLTDGSEISASTTASP